MYQSIAEHLKDGVVNHQQLVEIPEGTVVATCRRIDEDGDYQWTWQVSEGVSLESELVRAALEGELGAVAREIGVPFPWWP